MTEGTQKTTRISRFKVALATLAIGAVLAMPAGAADTTTQTVEGGTRSASIADLAMTNVTYSHSDQTNTSTMVLTADDSTGTDDGWNVTVQAGTFNGTGTDSIAASNFAIGTPAAPTVNSGQAIDPTGGPNAGVGGTLDAARMVLDANAGFGKGNYSQNLPVTLTIPGQTLADTYTSSLTVTIGAGPSV